MTREKWTCRHFYIDLLFIRQVAFIVLGCMIFPFILLTQFAVIVIFFVSLCISHNIPLSLLFHLLLGIHILTIYLYMYKYCNPLTDCFIVTRHTRCFQLGSKPLSYRYSQRNWQNCWYIFAYAQSATGLPNSCEQLCMWQPAFPHSRVQTPGRGSIYIVNPKQTVSLYHKTSVWQDTRNASN